MKVSQWAEIRRLVEVEKLSRRAVAQRLNCCFRTVAKALAMDHPPAEKRSAPRGSLLDPYKPKIDALMARYPQLSAARVMEEIRRGPDGYRGQLTLVRIYLRKVRPRSGRVYQEVEYEPGQAMQVDWGHCGQIRIGSTQRKVSVLVAVLCYSRLCYIEFTLSQRKAEFYRAIVNALTFFGGSPRRIIFDNLKAAVLNGSGRHACLHPEFLALCGHFCLEPIACERRDPESKGTVEAGVRYVKRNALAGREDELLCWDDYRQLAVTWRDEVANVRLHQTTRQRPVDRFAQESGVLRPLPGFAFDTDEVVPAIVSSHARIHFDGNRYSVPPALQNATVMIRASDTQVRVIANGDVAACHDRSYDRNQRISLPDHRLAALKLRSRVRARDVEEAFDALGEEAREFHLELRRQPVRTSVHLRRLLNLVHLYGRRDVVAAIDRANVWKTFDAAYVETILLQDRRRRELPSPTQVRPRREELLEETDLEEPDPGKYDRLLQFEEEPEYDSTEIARTAAAASERTESDADRGDLPRDTGRSSSPQLLDAGSAGDSDGSGSDCSP
jgi:transposase